MIKYSVRSRQLIDIVGDLRRGKIILSPYFQRNLVWRLIHKQDFIKTILLGYPFPQIFLAKGGIDVNALTSLSLIVDGQQRMHSIVEFISGGFTVDGKNFDDLDVQAKDQFLKYEVAIIELEMEGSDPNIKEVFKRLNRTFYSLTNIEKLSTEYAASEFMLLAKFLIKDIELKASKDDHSNDPNIPEEFIKWASKKKVENFQKVILEGNIFSSYEIARSVHLMLTLNLLGTIERGFFNRNISTSILEEYTETFSNRDTVVEKLDKIAKKITDLNLGVTSYWLNKANFFSLVIIMYNNFEELVNNTTSSEISRKLTAFELNIPEDYQLAAKEAVNNKKERTLRNNHLKSILIDN